MLYSNLYTGLGTDTTHTHKHSVADIIVTLVRLWANKTLKHNLFIQSWLHIRNTEENKLQ